MARRPSPAFAVLAALAALALGAWWFVVARTAAPASAVDGSPEPRPERAAPANELVAPAVPAAVADAPRASVEGTLVLSGRVVFGDGRAAFSAPLTVSSERDPSIELRATAGVDGTFRVAVPERGLYTLRAEKDRATITASEQVACRGELVHVVAPAFDLRLELAAPFELRGRAFDPRGGPLTDASVHAVPLEPDGAPMRTAKTETLRSPEGRFAVILPHGGPWRIGVSARCLAPSEERDLVVTGLHEGLEFVCREPATLTGRVVDSDGLAVADARILGVQQSDELDVDFVGGDLTDANGEFRIGCVLPGAQSIWADADEYVESRTQRLELVAGETRAGLLFELGRGATLVGTVACRFEDPNRRAGWELERLGSRGHEWGARTSISSTPTSVRNEARSLPPGEYQVALTVHDRLGERRFVQTATLRAGETTELVFVDDALPTVAASGRVLAAGVAQAGCELTFERDEPVGMRQRTVCDATGRFACDLPLSGKWRIRFEHSDGATWLDVDVPSAPTWSHEFELGGASLAGRVVGDAKARAGALIQLSSEPGQGSEAVRSTKCDADGAFVFAAVPSGRYTLELSLLDLFHGSGKELVAAPIEGVELAAGERRTGLELVLREGATVALRVQTDEPAVWLVCDREGPRNSGFFEASGDWRVCEVGGFLPGRVRAFVLGEESIGCSPWFELGFGELRELEVPLHPGGFVAPRFVTAANVPVERDWRLRDADEHAFAPQRRCEAAGGAERFGPLLAGDWELVVDFGPRERVERFTVRAGETTDVVVRVE